MPVKTRKPVQTCGGCGVTGHNRRRCPGVVAVASVLKTKAIKKVGVAPTKKSVHPITPSPKSKQVFVKIGDVTVASPHVVNFKDQDRTSAMGSVRVYQEPAVALPVRKQVDFAALVREHTATVTVQSTSSLHVPHNVPRIPSVSFATKMSRVFGRMTRAVFGAWDTVATFLYDLEARLNYKVAAYGAVSLFLVVAIPLPAIGYYQKIKDTNIRVADAGTHAFQALQSSTAAAFDANMTGAKTDLETALAAFDTAHTAISGNYALLLKVAKVLPFIGPQVLSRESVLSAGEHVALGNAYLMKGFDAAHAASTGGLTDSLAALRDHIVAALPEYQAAEKLLVSVSDDSLPDEYRRQFKEFQLVYAAFVDDLSDLSHLADAAHLIFGGEQFHRYLIVFQNQHELRPTGGFPGSLAIVDVQKGKITNIEIPGGGPYDLQGQLKAFVKPPLPLQLLNKRWEFQDVNWFPDFPTSAEKMAWFYQQSRGTTIDGVIAVNASVLERVLRVIGPVTLADKQLTISADNALATIQDEVENKYDHTTNKPKAVVGDLFNLIRDQLSTLDRTETVLVLSEFQNALQQKEIQFWTRDTVAEQQVQMFGWTGEVAKTQPDQDFLMVVDTNIRSQKSNAKIEQTIDHQAVVSDDGTITDTVVIHRTHHGTPGEEFYGGPNVSYLRLYVPEGATIVAAGGFTYPPEDAFRVPDAWATDDPQVSAIDKTATIDQASGTVITHEFGKTAFGNWIQTNPGDTSEAYITYRLPWRASVHSKVPQGGWQSYLGLAAGQRPTASYSLHIEKQSGTESHVHASLIFPDGWRPQWTSSSDMTLAKNGGELQRDLQTDIMYGVVASKDE